MTYIFPPAAQPAIPIVGTDQTFPVHRIYCIGRNYAAHAKEMDALNIQPSTDEPIFFSKPADAAVPEGGNIPFPTKTQNLQHEVELVVAVGQEGQNISAESVNSHILGYAVGCDLTRRDLQSAAKQAGSAWDTSKGFDHSAPLSPICLAEDIGHPVSGRIWLTVNGETRQEADLSEMLWPTGQIISVLSQFYVLKPGDLIFTGTPAGVSKIEAGDDIHCGIDPIGTLNFQMT